MRSIVAGSLFFCLTNAFCMFCSSSDANSDSGSRHSSVSSQASREEYVNVEDQECCPRCGKRVFFAEQVLSLGRKWHKPCFRCGQLQLQVVSFQPVAPVFYFLYFCGIIKVCRL